MSRQWLLAGLVAANAVALSVLWLGAYWYVLLLALLCGLVLAIDKWQEKQP